MEVKILTNDNNTLEFEIIGGENSLAQLLVEKLNGDKSVEFAASKLEHPVIANPKVFVRTKKKEPLGIVLEKLEEIEEEVTQFRKEFEGKSK